MLKTLGLLVYSYVRSTIHFISFQFIFYSEYSFFYSPTLDISRLIQHIIFLKIANIKNSCITDYVVLSTANTSWLVLRVLLAIWSNENVTQPHTTEYQINSFVIPCEFLNNRMINRKKLIMYLQMFYRFGC